MIVENAKQHMATAVKIETQLPYVGKSADGKLRTCCCAITNRHAAAEDDKCCQRTDHDRIRKYLKDSEKSLFYRFSVSAQACAIEPVPSPASLEKYLWKHLFSYS